MYYMILKFFLDFMMVELKNCEEFERFLKFFMIWKMIKLRFRVVKYFVLGYIVSWLLKSVLEF